MIKFIIKTCNLILIPNIIALTLLISLDNQFIQSHHCKDLITMKDYLHHHLYLHQFYHFWTIIFNLNILQLNYTDLSIPVLFIIEADLLLIFQEDKNYYIILLHKLYIIYLNKTINIIEWIRNKIAQRFKSLMNK